MSMNINGKDDNFGRYRMPKVKINNAGKGNGKFTMIRNLDEVSKSIGHPIKLLLKFIGISLNCNSNEEKMCITGHYSEQEIQDKINLYNQLYVLCPTCGLPELTPEVIGKKKKKGINVKCSACGFSNILKNEYKYFDKGLKNIIIHIERNGWKIVKGTMVESKQDSSNPFKKIF
jgi:translation initiation factor 2 subunit 2